MELDSDTSSLDAGLNSSIDKMEVLDEKTGKTDNTLKKFGGAAGTAGKAVLGVSTAIIAAGSAMSAFITVTAKNRQELDILARQTKISTDEFSALAFATKQYGIEGEQIADISKDISDKLGEFGAAGTGPFQDFADVIGITKEEAQVLAIQMQDMSGPQVIGKLVGMMEDAGASTNEMTFALESMGNDLSRLIPLFSDGSRELKSLQSGFESATAGMKLTQKQAEELKVAATSFDALTASISASSDVIAANLAPAVTEFFNEIKSIIPLVTQDLVNFINSFKSVGELSTVGEVSGQINVLNSEIEALQAMLDKDIIYASGEGWLAGGSGDEKLQAKIDKLKQLEDRLNEIKKANESKPEAPGLSGDTGNPEESAEAEYERILLEIKKNNLALEAEARAAADALALEGIQDRFKKETELLEEKLEEELILIGDDKGLKLSLEKEYADNLVAIEQEKNDKLKKESDKKAKIMRSEKDKEARQDKKAAQQKDRNNDSILSSVKSLNTSLLDDNKAIGAGIIVADTARASMRAIADLGPIAGPLAAAAIAATGLTQLANLNGAERGGGSISGSSTAAVDTSIPEQAQESDQILLSQSDTENGNQSVIIKFEGDGNEITEALAKSMKVMQRSGALEA